MDCKNGNWISPGTPGKNNKLKRPVLALGVMTRDNTIWCSFFTNDIFCVFCEKAFNFIFLCFTNFSHYSIWNTDKHFLFFCISINCFIVKIIFFQFYFCLHCFSLTSCPTGPFCLIYPFYSVWFSLWYFFI